MNIFNITKKTAIQIV